MSLLWSREVDGCRYEVRTAGGSRRLYTDGVFHSQYNPGQLITGGVWDLMMLPAFLLPPNAVQRVLLLGLGGGTAVHQLRAFVRPRQIIAVELDAVHLEVARDFFDLGGEGVELQQADAVRWVTDHDGDPFDLVIDDLYCGGDGEPSRAVPLDDAWLAQLAGLVAPGGALAINTLGPAAAADAAARLQHEFPGALQLRAPYDRNAVAAFFRQPVEARQLRRNLMAVPGLNPQRKSSRLRFECRSLAA